MPRWCRAWWEGADRRRSSRLRRASALPLATALPLWLLVMALSASARPQAEAPSRSGPQSPAATPLTGPASNGAAGQAATDRASSPKPSPEREGADKPSPAPAFIAPPSVAVPGIAMPTVPPPRSSPPPTVGDAEGGTGAAPRLVEQPPEIHYLPDESGRLVPVPGFGYRDFLELLELKSGLPVVPRPPDVVVERVEVDVDARDGDADARGSVVVRIDLRQSRAGQVGVSLGLGGMFLGGAPEHEGPGRFFIEGPRDAVPAAGRGFRGWVEGAADDRHRVTLAGTVTIDRVARSERFTLDLPAATTSRVTIRTDRDPSAVAVEPPGLPPRSAADPRGGSLVVCEGIAGRTRFRVGAPDGAGDGAAGLPRVTTESVVRIDGRGATFDTSVRIEPFPAESGTVRIALPARCTPIRVREPASLLRVVPLAQGNPEGPTEVEVSVARRTDGSAVVELECERAVDAAGRGTLEVLGFAVADVPAWRQRGRVSLLVAGDWQLDWDDPTPVRRVDPPPAARQPGFVAAFAHDALPATLPLRVRPRASRVVVEPEYRYTVGATRIVLDATFRVAVRGAAVARLAVGLDGWTVDEAGPATLVDSGALAVADGTVVLPFLQPLSGDAVVELRAVRDIDRARDTLAWSTPQPRADLVGPATVTVGADADIEVLPDGDGIKGLVRRVVPTPRRAVGDRAELVYRLEGTEGAFAATRRFLPRRVEAEIDARVSVGAGETTVEETIRLDVANAALESVDVLLPAGLDADAIDLLQGGQTLSPFALPVADPELPGDGAGALRTLLPVPVLGEGTLVVRYAVPTPEARGDDVALRVPLLVPRGARVSGQTLLLGSDGGVATEVRGDGWRRDAVRTVAAGERAWVAARPQSSIDLALAAARADGAGETVVEAAWLESRLFTLRREESCTYVISTAARRIEVGLPGAWLAVAGAAGRSTLDVRVDGMPVAAAPRDDGTLVIDVPRPNGSGRATFLLRLRVDRPWSPEAGGEGTWFGVPSALGIVGPVTLETPRFPSGTLERRFFREIHLPEDEHLLGASSRWTPQQRWTWRAGGLWREPVVSRAVLAEWIAATLRAGRTRPGEPDPSADPLRLGTFDDAPLLGGRAVFAGTGSPGRGQVWLLPTWALVLAVSGPLLGVGLAMAYRPGWRRLPAVFALVLPAMLAAVAFPAIAPLVVQAALPGLALSLLAAMLRRAAEPAAPAVERAVDGSSSRVAAAPSLVVNVPFGDDSDATLVRRAPP